MTDSLAPNSTPLITQTDRENQVSIELLGTATKGLMLFSKTITQECWPLPVTLTEQKGLIIATTKPCQPYRTFCALSCQGSLSFSNISVARVGKKPVFRGQRDATQKKKDPCLQQCKQILCSTEQSPEEAMHPEDIRSCIPQLTPEERKLSLPEDMATNVTCRDQRLGARNCRAATLRAASEDSIPSPGSLP